jgi:hypothetical protein
MLHQAAGDHGDDNTREQPAFFRIAETRSSLEESAQHRRTLGYACQR